MRPHVRRSHIWTDNIKQDLEDINYLNVDGFIWLRIGTSGRL
jgi:hypothetical protein